MATAAQKQYTNELRRKFGYYATWNPGVPLSLGDVGTLSGNIFTRLSSLNTMGINFAIRTDNTTSLLEHNSQGSVTVTTKVAGSIAPQGSVLTNADVGLIVEFSKENSTLFKANDTRSPSIEDTITLGNEIIRRYKDGNWSKSWVVITELVEATSGTVLIANKANGKIELKANANINAPTIDIADASFQFSTQFSTGLETKIIAAQGLTPLFKVMGIKSRIFLPPIFKSQGVKALDLLTPETAKTKYKDDIYLGYISPDVRE